MAVYYLDQLVIIPFYFTYQGKFIFTDSGSGSVDIYQIYPSFSLITSQDLEYNLDFATFVLKYNFPSSLFRDGTYLLKATLNYNNLFLKSQRIINLKSLSSDLSLLDLFEISKFIFTEDLEDIDIDRLVLVFEIALSYIEGFIGSKLQPQERTYIISKDKLIKQKFEIRLPDNPILQVISIKDLDTQIEIPFTIIDKEIGKIILSNSPISDFVEIKYVYGLFPIPQGLLNILYELTGILYDRVKYMNFDRIATLGLTQVLNKDTLSEIEKQLIKYKKII